MSEAAKPWAPEKCPITQRPLFMWIEHHRTGEMVPTYGGPYDSYTLAEFDGEDFVCERFDHDAGGWLVDCVEGLGVKLVDDQSLVIDPNNTRYDEIEAFAAAPVAAQSSAPEIPPEKPLPDLMMASYHEAIGWNKCRKEMIAAYAQPDPRTPADMLVNGGALILALNALRRAGKNEIADELEKTATPAQQPVSGADGLPELPDIAPTDDWDSVLDCIKEYGMACYQAALAQQDADKVDAERWRAYRSSVAADDAGFLQRALDAFEAMGIEDGKVPSKDQIDAAIDAARKELA